MAAGSAPRPAKIDADTRSPAPNRDCDEDARLPVPNRDRLQGTDVFTGIFNRARDSTDVVESVIARHG
jgi:hypothetical protein